MALHSIKAVLSLLALLLLATASSIAVTPNVVIFLADDAGWGDYRRNGNTMVRTPNIDSIAAGGVTMDLPGVLADARGVPHRALSSADRRVRRLDGAGADVAG